jgi:DNA topoisomerase III
MTRVLCVAEKPSISKAISEILSGGHPTVVGSKYCLPQTIALTSALQRNTRSRFIKNYDFQYPQTNSFFTVTCVVGHLTHHDFDEYHRKWNSCEPFALFDAPVQAQIPSDKKDIERNIYEEASRADMLMIWTDCDREGEHIGVEIAQVAQRAKRNIVVKRARFSAIIAQYVITTPGSCEHSHY